MKLMDEIKYMNKEYVYEGYYRIVSNPKDYDKITKVKMLNEIYNLYSDYNYIIDICTSKELKYLESILNGTNKDIDYKDYKDINIWITRTLCQKFLLIYSLNTSSYEIPEEIIQSVKLAVKNVSYKKKKQADELNELLVSYFKQVGSSLIQSAYQFAMGVSSVDSKTILEHIIKDKVFNYYVIQLSRDVFNNGKEIPYGVYADYLDYIDEIDEKRKVQGLAGSKKIDLKVFKTLFYYDFDINNKIIKEFLDELYNQEFFLSNVINEIKIYSALNEDRKQLKTAIQNIPIVKYKDLSHLFKLMDKAMDEMPSCVLNGFTPNETKNIKMLEIKSEFKKAQSYIPQSKACLDKDDAKLFYKLYFALLDYTNSKYNINPHVKLYKKQNINPEKIRDIIEKLWDNKDEIFTEFIKNNPYKFNDNELNILKEMSSGIRNMYIICKYENEYTGFMAEQKIYMVKGINDNIDNIIPYNSLPYPVITTIMPFKGNLIFDSILLGYGIKIDASVANEILNEYEKMQKYYHL